MSLLVTPTLLKRLVVESLPANPKQDVLYDLGTSLYLGGVWIAGAPEVEITDNTVLTNALHNGRTLKVAGAYTLTIDDSWSGSCIVKCPASGNVSVARSGTATLNGAATTLTRARTNNWGGFTIQTYEANTIGVSGA